MICVVAIALPWILLSTNGQEAMSFTNGLQPPPPTVIPELLSIDPRSHFCKYSDDVYKLIVNQFSLTVVIYILFKKKLSLNKKICKKYLIVEEKAYK